MRQATNIWDDETKNEPNKKPNKKPIELISYLNPNGRLKNTSILEISSYYDNITRLRQSGDRCIVMCWKGEKTSTNCDIYTAKWNDGVF